MASSAGYICRRSPSGLDPSPSSEEQGNLAVDDCHMLEARLSKPPKRQHSGQHLPQSLLKRKKLNHSHHEVRSRTPAAFYDNLSKVWLTKGALRELDRRNAQPAPSSPCPSRRQPHRPFTRHALVELRKSCRSTQSASDFLCYCTSRCLKDIKRLAKHGGPDLLDLRGDQEPTIPLNHAMTSIQSSSQGRSRKRASTFSSKTQTTASAPTTTTGNTTPQHRNFQQNLIDHGVYPEEYEYHDGRVPPTPDNWEEIKQRLIQPRPSLSPSQFSDGAFRKFKRADAHASKENKVTDSVIPIIEGDIRDGRCVSGGIPLTNLDHLTDGTLSPGNPDLFYGAHPEQLNRRIRNELRGHIVPSTQGDLPMAPNFFLAAKGPNESAAVARRQACYDGALGARGIQSLQSYGQPVPVYDNHAYTVTSIYNDGQLKMYTSHPSHPTGPENRPEYFMNQLRSFSVTDTPGSFRQGATAYRNARDWAKEKRDEFIEAANGRMPDTYTESQSSGASCHGRASVSTAGPVLVESHTSADELTVEERTYTLSENVQEGSFQSQGGRDGHTRNR